MDEFDLPFAYEALARAHRIAGAEDEAARNKRLAREAGASMTDAEGVEHFEEALATL